MARSRLAAVILAHADSAQARRLFAALPGVDLFLHCDLATPREELSAMVMDVGDRVHVLPRQRTPLSGWSLVSAELQGVRSALAHSDAAHIVVMSGACYPLWNVRDLETELEAFAGRSLLDSVPLPHEAWGTTRNPDGGLWRFNRRFASLRGRPLHVRGVPIRGRRQSIPAGLVLHAGSQWKVYARAHARRLIEVADSRPDIVKFFTRSFVPDESFAPTVLNSPELVGDAALEMAGGSAWYMEWPPAPLRDHPVWLSAESFDALAGARLGTGAAETGPAASTVPTLFARKVGSGTIELVQRIDAELRRDLDPPHPAPTSRPD